MIAQVISFRTILGFALVAALAAIITVFATQDGTHAASFNPIATICLDNLATEDIDPLLPGHAGECDGDNTPGASTALTGTLTINAPDSNFGGLVSFTPPEWGVALDADIADGTQVAELRSQAVLGLLNNACSSRLFVNFLMLDATTNQATQVTFDDQFDLVGGIPRGATEYPDYLSRVLVAVIDDFSTTLQPIARYYGQTSVSGVDVSLNFVLFEPGITLRGTPIAAQLGYPSVTVLQSLGDPNNTSTPGAITDFCSPLKTATNTFASVRTNPSADGTYTYVTFTQDQRDADGDGHENSLDSCPFTPNPNWDPRADKAADGSTPGDRDSDRIPDECDPLPDDLGNPGVGAFNDHDGDTYLNAQDNCPLIANSLGAATSPFANEGDNNQADRDNDGIGDSCDLNPDTPDGLQTVKCFAETLTIGSGGTPSIDPEAIRNLQSFSPCGTDLGLTDPSSGDGGATPTTAAGGNGGGGVNGGGTSGGGVGGGPDSGIGSLSPGASSFPAWAAVLAAVAIAGILGGIYVLRTGPAADRRE